jgi:phage gp46-like protein
MSDIALRWTGALSDVVIAQNDLLTEDGLNTAVIASLFTDRRAEDSDILPDGTTDRRGWWGDAFPTVSEDKFGSRLWLLSREKQQQSVLDRAVVYAKEALQWLIDDQVAQAIDVVAEFTKPGMLGLSITITRPASASTVDFKFYFNWAAQEAALS